MKIAFDCLRKFRLPTLCLAAVVLAGCGDSAEESAGDSTGELERDGPTVTSVAFEPNYVYAYAAGRQFEFPLEQPRDDAYALSNEWFGTPDAPKLPPLMTEEGSEYADLLDIDSLKMAAGPAPDTTEPGERGLYRQLCISCHGETGQGRGSLASSQNPYPRNFRKGIFKYKLTPRNAKPTREDIVNTLHRGLAGSQMPRFDYLSEQQRTALAEYVIYLSIRGQFERKLMNFAAFELDPYKSAAPSPDSRLYAPESENLGEQLEVAEEELMMILDEWIDAEDEVEEIDIDVDFPILGATDSEDIDREALEASIARGQALFAGSIATCSKCHGKDGQGQGEQIPDYDDWTKEMTSAANIDPKSEDDVLELLIRGALPPQPLGPRNLVDGQFRGGGDPTDIYRRIVHGIPGAPMPAAALARSDDEIGLSESDVWDLVNFVLSLSRVQL